MGQQIKRKERQKRTQANSDHRDNKMEKGIVISHTKVDKKLRFRNKREKRRIKIDLDSKTSKVINKT